MPRVKLTEKTVTKLLAPDPSGRQILHWDTELRGFGVLCSGVKNSKTYVVQRDLPDGRTRRLTIGATNVLGLDKARADAIAKLAELYQGVDPKQTRRAQATLRETLQDYLEARKDLSATTRQDYEASITKHLASWLDRPLREITSEMVEDRHREIKRGLEAKAAEDRKRREAISIAKGLLSAVAAAVQTDDHVQAAAAYLAEAVSERNAARLTKGITALRHAAKQGGLTVPTPTPALDKTVQINGNAAANGAMRVLRILWNFAAERTELPPNPVRRLRRQWYAVPRRETLVRADELPKFYTAVKALPNEVARDYLLLLLFTGLRRREAASLTWEEIDFAERVIRLPAKRTKAGRKLDLPMTDAVRDLLVTRRSKGVEKFVFPSDGKLGHFVEPKFPLRSVRDACGVSVSAHDLRRTFITVAESTDISPLALKALVNHALGNDVTSGYIVMTVDRLREPAQKVCDRMKALCEMPARVNDERIATLK